MTEPEDLYFKDTIELLEKYGWDVAESCDEDPEDRGIFAYWPSPYDTPADWITSCETVDDIRDWLLSKEGTEWRKTQAKTKGEPCK